MSNVKCQMSKVKCQMSDIKCKCFDNFDKLLPLIHWLQLWQLRTWFHDNRCFLTINCDTGQHLQFLWCLKSFYYYIWFHFPGVSFHSNFPRLSATARVHINPRPASKHVRLGNPDHFWGSWKLDSSKLCEFCIQLNNTRWSLVMVVKLVR